MESEQYEFSTNEGVHLLALVILDRDYIDTAFVFVR